MSRDRITAAERSRLALAAFFQGVAERGLVFHDEIDPERRSEATEVQALMHVRRYAQDGFRAVTGMSIHDVPVGISTIDPPPAVLAGIRERMGKR